MTDCLFTAYSGARDSGPKHAGERSERASVVRESASGGECLCVSIMFASVSARPPGFTTAPTTGARVAAMQRSTNPTATVACSSDHGAGTFFSGRQPTMGNFTFATHSLAYDDYVRVETRRYAMVARLRESRDGRARRPRELTSWFYASQQPARWPTGGSFFAAELPKPARLAGLSSATRRSLPLSSVVRQTSMFALVFPQA